MKEYHRKRISSLRATFEKHKLKGALLTSLKDIFYYTGNEVTKGDPGFLLVTKNKHMLYVTSLDNHLKGPGVRILNDFKEMKAELSKSGKLGFDEKNMTVLTYKKLKASKWKPLSSDLKALRMVKDKSEISLMRKSAKETLDIFKKIKIQGKAETSVLADIQNRIFEKGLKPSFDPIIASGKNSSFVHYSPGKSKITKGFTIIDMGVKREKYNSDITRTYLLDPSERQERLYEQVKEIQSELISMATPERKFSDLQNKYGSHLKKLGYPTLHGFGHGLGLSVHERPGMGDTLKKGMVITVEPGIYKKGLGGCRIEDMVLVSDKPKILSRP